MKKAVNIFVLLSYIMVCSCNSFDERKFALEVTGFDMPSNIILFNKDDKSYYNPSGDGERLAIFSFNQTDSVKLIDSCIKYKFTQLPIDVTKLTDGVVFTFIDKEEKNGYYKLNIDTEDHMSYSIAVVDFSKNKIYIYRVLY